MPLRPALRDRYPQLVEMLFAEEEHYPGR